MNNKIKINIVGLFEYPSGDASSAYLRGLVKSCHQSSESVYVYPGIRSVQANQGFVYVIPVDEYDRSESAIKKFINTYILSGSKSISKFSSGSESTDFIISYGGSISFVLRFLLFAKKNKIPLILCIGDWFDGSHLPMGKYGLFNILYQITFNYLYPKYDGYIVMSTLLRDKFCASKPYVLMPPTSNDRYSPGTKSANNSAILFYGGTPGKKDRLDLIIQAVEELFDNGENVTLKIAGLSSESLSGYLGRDYNPDCIVPLGRIPQAEIPVHLFEAEFTMLVRDNERFANAGFPTKFVESLVAGKPVICNITSDLGAYLKDSVNGYVIGSTDIGDIKSAIKRAIMTDPNDYFQMSSNAIKTADLYFRPECYSDALNKLFNSLKGECH